MKRYIVLGICLLLACVQSINAQLFKGNPTTVNATIGNVYSKTEVDALYTTETNRAQIAESVNATNWFATVNVVSNRVTSLDNWKLTGVNTNILNNYARTNTTYVTYGIITNNVATP